MNTLRLQKTDRRKTCGNNILFEQKDIIVNVNRHTTLTSAGIPWIRIDYTVPEETCFSAPVTLKIKQDIPHV